ncbi:MAG: DUF615 domain-containing protein [Betaproteobacteria bacterium]|nr:DUF615 domain-containing protein [Betaproteobacteria bacterium]
MTDTQDDTEAGPSKSRRKREMTALQDLGEALVALPEDRITAMDLPDALRDAVLEAKGMNKFGALRRQLQYVGKLMRRVDADAVRAQLDAIEGHSHAHAAWLHRLERWRERLLADDASVGELVRDFPSADVQHLRTLLRNARREHDLGKPPRAYREIFQFLKALTPEPGTGAPTQNEGNAHE